MSFKTLRLRKGEERRIIQGHSWIYSNEIDTKITPLTTFKPGDEVEVLAFNQLVLGSAYINPHSLIAARLYSREIQPLNLDFFKEKIAAALTWRQRLWQPPFYRLVYSEGDNLPGLIIDRFGDDFVVQVNSAGMELKIELISEALRDLLPQTRSILLRNDSTVREREGLDTYVRPLFGSPPAETTLEENGAYFIIPLLKGQKTGWFYDHRLNRARLKAYVANRKVLDVFSYLGAWGIEAALFGATQVDCIEASPLASEFILRNAKLNQVEEKVKVLNEEAFDSLKSLLKANQQYDVIILDPPAFIKKLKDKKEGMIAYQRLNEMALKLLAKEGLLVTCSCSMHVSAEDLRYIIQKAALRSNQTIQIIERGHQAPDHPLHPAILETDYLKACFIRKVS